jgi:hypothetical protein
VIDLVKNRIDLRVGEHRQKRNEYKVGNSFHSLFKLFLLTTAKIVIQYKKSPWIIPEAYNLFEGIKFI